jgi:hypothetical protein
MVMPFSTTPFVSLANNISSVTSGALSTSDTILNVTPGQGALFPAAPFYISVEFEVMRVTSKTGDQMTVSRGQDGTSTSAHPSGSIIEMRGNAAIWREIQSAVNNIESGSTPIPFSVPDGSITNAKLAADVIRPSLLSNGGFEQWHRGPGPFLANGAYNADSWQNSVFGSDSLSVSKDTVNSEYGACAACTFTLNGGGGSSSIYTANGGGLSISDVIGKQVTFSVRVRCNVANAVRIGVNNGTGTTYSGYHNGNGTYQTLSLTVFMATVVTQCSAAIYFSASCTAFIDNATLVLGAAASNYSPAQLPDIIPNERLSSDVGRDNLISNGGFEVWQRGAGTFTANTGVSYFADRWFFVRGASDTLRADKSTAADNGSQFCAAITCTYAGGFSYIQQVIKVTDGPSFRGKTISASIRVYSGTANMMQFGISSDGTVGAQSPAVNNTLTNQWQTLTSIYNVPTDATQIAISIVLLASGVVYLDNCTVVTGAIAADYIPMHPVDELTRCQRYYEIISAVTGEIFGAGLVISPTAGQVFARGVTPKAITPTITLAAPANFSLLNNGGSPITGTVATASLISRTTFVVSISVASGVTQGNATAGYSLGTNIITAEANP